LFDSYRPTKTFADNAYETNLNVTRQYMNNETNILLMIANSDYSKTEKYSNLNYCIEDINLMKEFFLRSYITFDKVYEFKNSTYDQVQNAINKILFYLKVFHTFKNISDIDVYVGIYVYFSGLGGEYGAYQQAIMPDGNWIGLSEMIFRFSTFGCCLVFAILDCDRVQLF